MTMSKTNIEASTCNSKVEAAKILRVEVPSRFICPITLEVMSRPLKSKSGHNFERSAIRAWLRKGYKTCPLTRLPMHEEDLVPNQELENSIQFWTWENHIPESKWSLEPGSDRLIICHSDQHFVWKPQSRWAERQSEITEDVSGFSM